MGQFGVLVGGGIGLGIGSLIPGLGSQLGWAIGTTLGGLLFADRTTQTVGKMQNISLTGSAEGTSLPVIFGMARIGGNIIDFAGWREHRTRSGGGKGGGPTVEEYTYSTDIDIMICPGAIRHLHRIYANNEIIAEWDGTQWVKGKKVRFESITVYTGTETQNADPTFYAIHGALTSAHRGIAHVVIKNLYIDKWGNNWPNLEFEVWAGVPYESTNLFTESIVSSADFDKILPLSLIVKSILLQCDLTEAQIDVTDIEELYTYGHTFSGDADAQQMLQEIRDVYHIDILDSGGKVVAKRRPQDIDFTIPSYWVGVSTDGDPPEDPISFTRVDELQLPTSITLTFRSPDNNFQTSTAIFRYSLPGSERPENRSAEICLSIPQASEILRTMIYTSRVEGTVANFTLPMRYSQVSPGDLISTTYVIDGIETIFTLRVKSVSAGAPGHLEIQAVITNSDLYVDLYNLLGDDSYVPGTGSVISPPGDTLWSLFDVPAARDSDASSRVVYMGAAGDGGSWSGIIIRAGDTLGADSFSYDSGYSSRRFDIRRGSSIGQCLTTLSSGRIGVWDSVNSLTVEMQPGVELESLDPLEVLNYRNFALVGQEYIGFTTATLVATNVYQLSGLLRGLRGTEWAVDSHGADEPFLVLDDFVNPVGMNASMVGQSMTMRGYEIDKDIDTLPAGSLYTWVGRSRLPYAPCHLRSTPSGADLLVTWIRRVRLDGALRDFGDAPLDESLLQYRIQIFDGAILKRESNVTTELFTYTSAMRATDGFVPGDQFTVVVQQFSPVAGLGFAAEKTFTI